MIDDNSTLQYILITKFLCFKGVHSIAKFKPTIFLPEKVVPNIIINKNNLWISLVKRITPYAMVLNIIVTINTGLLPYESELGGKMKNPMNIPTI